MSQSIIAHRRCTQPKPITTVKRYVVCAHRSCVNKRINATGKLSLQPEPVNGSSACLCPKTYCSSGTNATPSAKKTIHRRGENAGVRPITGQPSSSRRLDQTIPHIIITKASACIKKPESAVIREIQAIKKAKWPAIYPRGQDFNLAT